MENAIKQITLIFIFLLIIACVSSCDFPNQEETTVTTDSFVEEIPHEHEYSVNVFAPTCDEAGYTKYTCNCGESYTEEYIDPTGHSWGDWTIAVVPTKTEDGIKERACACGTVEREALALTESYSEGLEYELNRDGLSYKVVGIGTFEGENLVIPNVYGDKFVTAIGDNAFRDCTSIRYVTIPDTVTHIGHYAFIFCYVIQSISIPESVVFAGDQAFSYCVSLKEIELPDSLTELSHGMFSWCTQLEHIKLGNNITYVKGVQFDYCYNLNYNEYNGGLYIGSDENPYLLFVKPQNNDIESFEFHSDTKIISGDAFLGVTTLKSISFPNSLIGIGNSAFALCESLESVVIPNSVKFIGDAFDGCESLKNVTMSSSIEEIDGFSFTTCPKIEYNEYNGGYYLGNEENPYIVLIWAVSSSDNMVTVHNDTKNIAGGAFGMDVKTIILGDSVTHISSGAFFYCFELENIVLGNSVTSIGEFAFQYCSSLTEIVIPDSVLKIGEKAFDGCDGITIYCEAEKKPLGWHNEWNTYYSNDDEDNIIGYHQVVWGYTNK